MNTLFSEKRIAVSSWTWHDAFYKGDLHLLHIPAKARESGISQVELNDFMLPPGRWSRSRGLFRWLFGQHNKNPKQRRYLQSTLSKLADELHENNVDCISWAIETNFTVAESLWQEELAYIKMGVQTAAKLKANMIRLTIGGSAQMGMEVDQLVIQRLKTILAHCKRSFPIVRPIVENHWGLTTDIGRYLKIIEAVDGTGVCFDPGNIAKQDQEEAWGRLAAKAAIFHLKIYHYHPDQLDQNIAYCTIFDALAANDYKGKVVIEYEGGEEPAETLKLILAQLRES